MQQAFGGIKEIKIANRESYFEEEFRKQNGLYTYDRRPKFPAETIRAILSKKAAVED